MEQNLVILAASGSRLADALRYLSRASSSRENLIFLLFAVIIAGIWITLIVWDRLRRAAAAQAAVPRTLFDQLCQAHRLDNYDASLLRDAARDCGVSTPAALFVEPDHLLRLSLDGLPNAASYRQLHERLFGTL